MQAENFTNMNDDDFTIASLAKLVGQELHTIDNNTITGKSGPANKLDPRSFLDQRRYQGVKNPYVAKHDGMVFHAGVDESVVQNMYPDPQPQGRAPQQPQQPQQSSSIPSLVHYEKPPIVSDVMAEYYQNNEKLLKSIDKTLKSIDKTQKALVDALSKFNSNTSIA